MSLLEESEDLLVDQGYEVWRHPDETDRLYFEDASIFGMVITYASPSDLVETWEDRQDEFLRVYRDDLRSSESKEKVWNAYTVHLTVSTVDTPDSDEGIEMRNALYQIEEDFGGTRKIVRSGVGDDDVESALLPLLEIKAEPELEASNYREGLRRELEEGDFEEAFLQLLKEDMPVDEIANQLLQDK